MSDIGPELSTKPQDLGLEAKRQPRFTGIRPIDMAISALRSLGHKRKEIAVGAASGALAGLVSVTPPGAAIANTVTDIGEGTKNVPGLLADRMNRPEPGDDDLAKSSHDYNLRNVGTDPIPTSSLETSFKQNQSENPKILVVKPIPTQDQAITTPPSVVRAK